MDLTVLNVGDRVEWILHFLSAERRQGVLVAVDGPVFDAIMADGRRVWGYIANIVTVNDRPVDNR